MRIAAAIVVLAFAARAQLKSTVPLVVAPITVTGAKGHYIECLTERDLLLYDNNVPQPIHLEYSAYPISLVVAVETNSNSEPAINKLGGSGILFANLIAARRRRDGIDQFQPPRGVASGFHWRLRCHRRSATQYARRRPWRLHARCNCHRHEYAG
jgi:hypothetical protein